MSETKKDTNWKLDPKRKEQKGTKRFAFALQKHLQKTCNGNRSLGTCLFSETCR